MTSIETRFIGNITVENTLGECVLSQPNSCYIWWTDIQSCRLYRYNFENKALEQWTTPERLCAFGFVHTHILDNNTQLVAAFESGFALYSPQNAEINWLAKPEQHIKGNRFNDGRVDRQGRFWSGCMVEDNNENPPSTLAGLYQLSQSKVTKVIDNINISNSLCWSLDSKTMYFADSVKQTIIAYDFDECSGSISNQRIFAQTSGDTAPDGSIIDAEGYLWNAQWGGSQVVRYAPNGDVDFVLTLPVSQPTCLTFGGTDMQTLFISTAREGLTEEQLKLQPLAGHILIYETNVSGVNEELFSLK